MMEKELLEWLGSLRSCPVEIKGETCTLHVLSARAVLEAKLEALELEKQWGERALCSNACLLAKSLRYQGRAVFENGEQALELLEPGEIGALAEKLGELSRRGSPSAEASWTEVSARKKAWSTRPMSG